MQSRPITNLELPSLPPDEREKVLRFAASFLWADLEVDDEERRFFTTLARELDVDDARATTLLSRPPMPEEIDPGELSVFTADVIRHVALHAIASDGQVREEEMLMFEILDDLMPRADRDLVDDEP
ncbi:MAG: hypothetical protein U0270_24915 [Labilithrix sp.]